MPYHSIIAANNNFIFWWAVVTTVIMLLLFFYLWRASLLLRPKTNRISKYNASNFFVENDAYEQIDQLPQLILFRLDHAGIITDISPSVMQALGYKAEDCQNKHLSLLCDKADELLAKSQTVKTILSTASPSGYKILMRHVDGRKIPVNILAQAILSPENEIIGLKGAIYHYPITEFQNEEILETILEKAPVLINAFDRNGNNILWNKECEKVFGYSQNEINSYENPLALCYPDDTKREAMLHALNQGASLEHCKWHTYNKQNQPLLTYWVNSKSSTGNIIGIGYDITEQQHKQDELNIRLHKIAARLPGMIYQLKVNPDGSQYMPYCSDAIKKLFNVTPEEAFQDSSKVYANIDPHDVMLMQQSIARCTQKLEPWRQEFRTNNNDGSISWFLGNAVPEREQDGSLIWHGFVNDITEQKKNQEQLRLAASVFMHSQQSILITNADNRIIDVNPAFLAMTGYTRQEAIGKTPKILYSGVHDIHFYKVLWYTLNQNGSWQGEIWNRKKNGELFAQQLTINAVKDNMGELQHYVAVASDITRLKNHEQDLQKLAYHDALTGLPNRRLLNERMSQAIVHAQEQSNKVAICYLDLDSFKKINDQSGHEIGDKVLVETAERLQLTIRTVDTLTRLGGDEFVLLMPNLNTLMELEQLLNRVLYIIAQPFHFPNLVVKISASIGVAIFPDDNQIAESLLRQADQAMYLAKRQGKNRFSFFDSKEEQRLQSEHETQDAIKTALHQKQLLLYYQPKVNMRTGRVIGVEALLRWQHPQRGLLLPGSFLSAVENTDIIVDIGNWVLREACLQLRAWKTQGLDLHISVNITAKQLEQTVFTENLYTLLQEFSDISPAQLELEILETVAMNDIRHIGKIISECSGLGVQFALDDFGTGYSSLTYLKNLPAKTIKIDQSFVSGITHSRDDTIIIKGIIGLTRAFERNVLAEGVKSIEHGRLLLDIGCELGQGNAIAEPMPIAKFTDWLDQYQSPWHKKN